MSEPESSQIVTITRMRENIKSNKTSSTDITSNITTNMKLKEFLEKS